MIGSDGPTGLCLARRQTSSMFDIAANFSRYRTYEGGSRIGQHVHTDSTLTLVLGGGYEETIGGRSSDQSRGSALVCPKGMPHAQRFGPAGARKLIVVPGAELLDYLATTTPFAAAPASRSTEISKLAARIDIERQMDDLFARGAIGGLIWQVAAEMGRDLTSAAVPSSTIVQRARSILDAEDVLPMSITVLCGVIGCHPATLTRAFRREHDCTPGEYQRRLRVLRAADQLKRTRAPIAEIATSCGFCDQAHLARSFRSILGCSPSDYRKCA